MMTIVDFVQLVDAGTKTIEALVWPSLVLFFLIRFGPSIRSFVADLGEFSLKGAGVEASWKRQQAEAASNLVAAAISRPEASATPDSTAKNARAATDLVHDTVTPRLIRRASRATILWVDDRPSNNVYERRSLEALGITFVLSTSTEDALAKLKEKSFDAIISDMGRPPDPKAGYTLLDTLRAGGDKTPFIIYASSRDPEHQAESQRRGALGCTNRADELFEMVLSALGQAGG